MSKKSNRISDYKPQYKWGGNTNLWAKETEQILIEEREENIESKSKAELQREINYGKRINYWH